MEDEAHFLLDCPLYDEQRHFMWIGVCGGLGGDPRTMGREGQLRILLGSGLDNRQVAKSVLKFVRQSMKIRKRALEEVSRPTVVV